MGSTLSCLHPSPNRSATRVPETSDDGQARSLLEPAGSNDVRWLGLLERLPAGFVDCSAFIERMPEAFRVSKGRLAVRLGAAQHRSLVEAMAQLGEGALANESLRAMLMRGHTPENLGAFSVLLRLHLIDITKPTEPAIPMRPAGRLGSLFARRISLLHHMAVDADEALPGTVVAGGASSVAARFAMLAEADVDLDSRTRSGVTPLMLSCATGSLAAARALIDVGASIAATDEAGLTALHWAAIRGHSELVGLLVQAGMGTDVRDKNGWTPLHWATREGQFEVMAALFAKGADPNARTFDDASPLMLAVKEQQPRAIEVLREAGADVNARHGPDKTTALHEAARVALFEEGLALLENGASPDTPNRHGMTPLHHAAKLFPGYPVPRLELARALINFGATVDYYANKSHNFVRPVDVAGKEGNEPVFKLLVEKGACPPYELCDAGLNP